jgi:hypothetical protein
MVAACLPILACVLLALLGPRLAVGARPAIGLCALSIGLGTAAVGTFWSLLLLSAALVDSWDPRPVGVAASALLLAGGWRAVRVLRGRALLHRALRAACPRPADSDVVVLDDPAPRAFAVPGRAGRIVVSSGMLAALDDQERQVLLAHERAHLAQRHHWHLGLAAAAVAVNPLLRPCREALAFLTERCADERAGSEVGDRELAAGALARAALAAHQHAAHQHAAHQDPAHQDPAHQDAAHDGVSVPAFHEYGVGRRVLALREPPPHRSTVLLLVALLVSAAIVAAEVDATGNFVHLAGALIR